jgi:hypothetical protein
MSDVGAGAGGDVLDEHTERTETRMQAASWLGDRSFGKAPMWPEAG